MTNARDEAQHAAVLEKAKQAGEANPKYWGWVERSVWTEPMLEALAKGSERRRMVQPDHFRWPNEFFRVHGLYSLVEAHRTLLQSPSG